MFFTRGWFNSNIGHRYWKAISRNILANDPFKIFVEIRSVFVFTSIVLKNCSWFSLSVLGCAYMFLGYSSVDNNVLIYLWKTHACPELGWEAGGAAPLPHFLENFTKDSWEKLWNERSNAVFRSLFLQLGLALPLPPLTFWIRSWNSQTFRLVVIEKKVLKTCEFHWRYWERCFRPNASLQKIQFLKN